MFTDPGKEGVSLKQKPAKQRQKHSNQLEVIMQEKLEQQTRISGGDKLEASDES